MDDLLLPRLDALVTNAAAVATAIAGYDSLESIRTELEALTRTATPDSTA
ncbi:hypothetical protein ACWDPV_14555 [Gordonia sp. NPDC003504]